jgi:hypothetical protein
VAVVRRSKASLMGISWLQRFPLNPFQSPNHDTTRLILLTHTAHIEGFFEVEKGIENAIKSTNFISKFCTLKSIIKLKLIPLCHSLFLEKFEFNHTPQGTKSANKTCTFYGIFYTLFYLKKPFYAGCVSNYSSDPLRPTSSPATHIVFVMSFSGDD